MMRATARRMVWYGMMQAQYRLNSLAQTPGWSPNRPLAVGSTLWVWSRSLRSWQPTSIGNVIFGLYLQRFSLKYKLWAQHAACTGNEVRDFEAIRFRKGLLHNSKVRISKTEGLSSSVYFSAWIGWSLACAKWGPQKVHILGVIQ